MVRLTEALICGGQTKRLTTFEENRLLAAQALCSQDTTELAKQKYARANMMIVKCAKKSSVLTPTRFTFKYSNDQTIGPSTWLKNSVLNGSWFGFAQVDIEVPKKLCPVFEEFCPLFVNTVLPEDAVSNFSLDYLEKTGRTGGKGKKLVGALSAQIMLIYAPLLKWYLEHGHEITKVHLTKFPLAKQKYAHANMMIVKCAKKSSVLTPTRFTCTR